MKLLRDVLAPFLLIAGMLSGCGVGQNPAVHATQVAYQTCLMTHAKQMYQAGADTDQLAQQVSDSCSAEYQAWEDSMTTNANEQQKEAVRAKIAPMIHLMAKVAVMGAAGGNH